MNLKRTLMILVLFTASVVYGQPVDEEPEPDLDTIYGYEAQIAWGSKTNLIWESVEVTDFRVRTGENPGSHSYGVVVVPLDRVLNWVGVPPTSTATDPKHVILDIRLPALPGNRWLAFYRFRCRPTLYTDQWSETSRWSLVVDPLNFPVIGPFRKI